MDGRPTTRVLIIGARGVLGGLAARAFRRAGWQVRAAARGADPGEVELDLDRPESVLRALREEELVVNTVPHGSLTAERLVLERGGTLINVSSLPAASVRALRAEAGGARGTVLMNAGLAPGVTTVAAADLLRRHPDAEELEMVFTVSAAARRGPTGAHCLQRGLAAVAHHRTAKVPLPEPFGERVCVGFAEGDAGWLGGIAEGRVVRPYVCILEPAVHEWLLTLNDLHALPRLAKSVIRARPPENGRSESQEPVSHWIAAMRGDRRLGGWTVRCRGGFAHAARSAVVFAEALLARPPGGGCFDPEEVCALEDVRARLLEAGVSVIPSDMSCRR